MDIGIFALKFRTSLLLLMVWTACRAELTIKNNAYSGLLVAINDGVAPDPDLLQGIRDAFTEASKFLYEITGNRAYFSNIDVLIPPSWPPDNSYEPAGNQRFENSHYRIFEGEPEQVPPTPVGTSTVCGESLGYGRFVAGHLTDSTSFNQDYGSYGKEIVYQWARTRFGVFDENPQRGEPLLYSVNFGDDYEGVRCSLQIPGSLQSLPTGLDCSVADFNKSECIFVPAQADGTFASLMYDHNHLDYVLEFCNRSDNTNPALAHNPVPDNRQNNYCNRRSVWEVIEAHGDYPQMANPRPGINTEPTYRFLRTQPPSVVFVLDTSGSMNTNNRIGKLSQGVTFFLRNVIQDESECGIVKFATTATVLLEINTVTATNREQFVNAVPTTAADRTSIGAGIRSALNLFKDINIVQGGIIVLVSDGRENESPLINEVFTEVLEAGVTIFTVAISDNADTGLEALAQSTGGNAFFSLDNDTSNAITEAFLDIGSYVNAGLEDAAEVIALYSEASILDPGETKTDTVVVDDTLGNDTEITFDYANEPIVTFTLTSPTGISYDLNSNQCSLDSVIRIITCLFPGNSETGVWQYSVTNTGSIKQRISAIFRSRASNPNDPPIVARVFWAITGEFTVVPGVMQRIFATVSKGTNPVLNAMVTAIVESSTASTTVMLNDNGDGADLYEDDGIYSKFFTGFDKDGRYTVKVIVNGANSTTTSLQTILGAPPPLPSGSKRRRKRATTEMTGMFQRIASGGTFNALGTASLTSTPYPPGRITDLRVLSTDTANYLTTLQWTAQGANLDVGAADEYEIRRCLDPGLTASCSVVTSTEVIQGDLSSPADAGTKETFTIQLPTELNTYFLGIVPMVLSTAADISNVVSLTNRPVTLASLGVTSTSQAPTTADITTTMELTTSMTTTENVMTTTPQVSTSLTTTAVESTTSMTTSDDGTTYAHSPTMTTENVMTTNPQVSTTLTTTAVESTTSMTTSDDGTTYAYTTSLELTTNSSTVVYAAVTQISPLTIGLVSAIVMVFVFCVAVMVCRSHKNELPMFHQTPLPQTYSTQPQKQYNRPRLGSHYPIGHPRGYYVQPHHRSYFQKPSFPSIASLIGRTHSVPSLPRPSSSYDFANASKYWYR